MNKRRRIIKRMVKAMNAEKREYAAGVAEEKRKKGAGKVAEVSARIFAGFLYAVFGYILGICRLPFGASPLGMAFLCAADRKVAYIFVGVCISSLSTDSPIIWICAYSAALLIRVLVRLTLDSPWEQDTKSGERRIGEVWEFLFTENICLRMTTSCVGAFAVGIYSLIVGGFLHYDLWGAILAMIVAPVGVLLSYGIFNGKKELTKFGYFSSGAVAFALIFSARAVSIYGVSVAAFGAAFVTLYMCRKKGMIHGIATGTICGLAYSPILAPAFIFAAVAFGALARVSVWFGSISAFTVGMAWGFYVGGISALTTLLPALLSATLLFAVIDKIFVSKDTVRTGIVSVPTAECEIGHDILDRVRLEASGQRMKNICSAFSDMSCFFRELGQRMKKPLAADVRQICDDAFDACCANCRQRELCWEEKYTDTIAAIAALSAKVHKSGSITAEDVPSSVRAVCERIPDVIDEINHNCALHTSQLVLCDKTEIFALDYEAMSDLIAGTMSLDASEFECNTELSEKICEAFNAEELHISAVAAYGKRKKRVSVRAESDVLGREKSRILETVERVSGESYSAGDITDTESGEGELTLTARRSIRAEYASRSAISEGEESFCGDTIRIFENCEDKFYALISDGMGSGRDAALTSGMCAMFLQRMLSAANRCDASLKLLNGFLRNKGGTSLHECSATVDLMELDLISGRVSFYKSGAAPTYVFRDGGLFKLRSKTVPIGIIRELDAKKISFDVSDGDVIVMVSDGATQGKDECPWLFELLNKSLVCEGLERTAELIIERARRDGGDDDVSVVMVKIESDRD